MAVLQGNIAASPIGGATVPAISPQLSGYGIDYWPPHTSPANATIVAPLVRALPVGVGARALVGRVVPNYLQDFYYRVHVQPAAIALGNVSSVQTRSISVWNAWPDRAVDLTAVQALNADGIDVSTSQTPPVTFLPLQERLWTVSVSTNGPPVIDATLQWLFAGLDPVPVRITGNRLIAWMLPPDWSDSLTETLDWLTDVQQANNGSQVRQVVRRVPRRQWEFRVLTADRERVILEAALYDWGARTWALPVWPDQSFLAAPLAAGSTSVPITPTGHDYAIGGLAMLWTGLRQYELVQVQDITATSLKLAQPTAQAWPKGTRVYPCRSAMLTEQPSLSRMNDRVMATQVRFQADEPCDWPAVGPTATYLGLPILDARGDEPQDPVTTYGRQLTTLDGDVGLVDVRDVTGRAWMTQTYHWMLVGRTARAAHRSLLYWFQGRAKACWLPSWTNDLTLTAPITNTGTILTVEWVGVTQFFAGQPGRRHLRIELANGTVFYRRVTNSTVVDTDTEQLAIDSALGIALAPAQVRLISWLTLVTLAGDTVEIEHVHDADGIANCGVTFAGVPMEEP